MVPEGIKFVSGLPKVQKSANFMPKGAIYGVIIKKECKKVQFIRFAMMQFP